MPLAAVVEFRGTMRRVADLAREHGILPCTLSYRLRHGWPLDQALATEAKNGNRQRPAARAKHAPVLGGRAEDVEADLDSAIARERGNGPPWARDPSNPDERRAPAPAPGRTPGPSMEGSGARLSPAGLRAFGKLLAEVEAVLLATSAVEIRRRDLLANVRRLRGLL